MSFLEAAVAWVGNDWVGLGSRIYSMPGWARDDSLVLESLGVPGGKLDAGNVASDFGIVAHLRM